MSPAAPVKILVLYDSFTGNVEQMARLVADGAREMAGVEVRLRKVDGEGERSRRMFSGPTASRSAARRTWGCSPGR